MNITELNKSLFELKDNYYVFVDEDKDGLLYYCKDFYWDSIEGKYRYEKEHTHLFAQRFEEGDPSIKNINNIWPHLSLYKVRASYQCSLEV